MNLKHTTNRTVAINTALAAAVFDERVAGARGYAMSDNCLYTVCFGDSRQLLGDPIVSNRASEASAPSLNLFSQTMARVD